MPNLIERAMADPRFERGLQMMSGMSPQQIQENQLAKARVDAAKQQQMDAQRQRAAMQTFGNTMAKGGLTRESVAELMKVSPEIGMKAFSELRKMEEAEMMNQLYDPSIPMQRRMQIAAQSRNPAAMQYLENEAAMAQEAQAQTALAPQIERTPQPDATALPNEYGAAPDQDYNALLQRRAEINRELGGTETGKRELETIDLQLKALEKQIPSPTERIKIEEERIKQDKAANLKNEVLRLTDGLLNPKRRDDLKRAVGPFSSRKPTVTGGAADVEADVAQLRSILTAENLGIMTGVLSESDLKVIADIAGGGIQLGRSEEGFISELERLRGTLKGGATSQMRAYAQEAIEQGVDPAAVAAEYKRMTGEDF